MKLLTTVVKKIKKIHPCIKTYMVEEVFVCMVLVAVAILSSKGLIEWLGVAAVFFTFKHSVIANRMEEAEANRIKKNEPIIVECYKKQTRFFYIKEILWFGYFIWLGAWSALVGVVVFLLYPLWRKVWRKYQPMK